jgi:Rod binding domain-containing protein
MMDFAPLSAALPTTADAPKPKNAAEAAQQFEALLLGQMLKDVHATEESQDPTGETMWDMAAQQFAQVLSKNGGLGLAKLIASGLDRTPGRKP